jgi:hypothetical protein
MQPDPSLSMPRERLRVTGVAEAIALVDDVIQQLAALAHQVGEETALVKAGKLSQAMSHEGRKGELAGGYMRALQDVKANAVSLARFAPDAVQRLKQAHGEFQDLIETNQAVLATARAVSEALMRDLAREANPTVHASGYGPANQRPTPFQRPATGPLVVSRNL